MRWNAVSTPVESSADVSMNAKLCASANAIASSVCHRREWRCRVRQTQAHGAVLTSATTHNMHGAATGFPHLHGS